MNERTAGAIVSREQDIIRWALEREIVAPVEDPQDFYRHADVLIWASVLRQRAASKSPDYLTVRADLDRRGQMDTVGAGYLLELSRDSVRPSDAAVITAADEIKHAARTRRLRAMLGRYVAADDIDVTRLSAELASLENPTLSAPPLFDDVAVLSRPQATYLIDGCTPERGLVGVVGPPDVGKTFLMIGMGLSIVTGRSFHGLPVLKTGPCVYVQAEGATGVRICAWKLAHGYDPDKVLGIHTWEGAVNLLDSAAVAAFIAAVKPLNPVAVFWDTLARCFAGGDENSAKDMGLAVAALDRVRVALGATQIVIHHMNKGGSSERGSSALPGACDTVLYLQKADDLLQLTCNKQKDGEKFAPVNLKLTAAYPGAPSLVMRLASEVIPDEALTDSQGKALHALTEMFGQSGATAGEWEAAIPAMPRASFYRAKKVLIETGYVREATSTGGRVARFEPTGKRPVSRGITLVSPLRGVESQDVSPLYQQIS